MPILIHNTFFLHVPKVAGTSIKSAIPIDAEYRHLDIFDRFLGIDWAHATTEEYREYYPWLIPQIMKKFRFTFVRNPYKRMLSEYRWRRIRWRSLLKHKTKFVQFIDNVANGHPYELPEHFKPQARFVEFDGQPVDFVGKYENLSKDWQTLCRNASIKASQAKLRRTNKSRKRRLRWTYSLLTPEAKSKIYKLYEEDFDTLEYTRG